MPDRPRLTPAVAQTRSAVREVLPEVGSSGGLVALSGGPDSLALAAAAAFEAPRAGVPMGAVVVDHGMQPGSAEAAERAAAAATALGLAPVLVRRVAVGRDGGPEAAARVARYAAFEGAMAETGRARVLLGHTLEDQAETVLLGLARGSGPDALAGMRVAAPPYLRPLLGLRRSATEAACADQGLDPWHDPMNAALAHPRVRLRRTALPALEEAIGPGVAEALARTAAQVQEDATALDAIAEELAPDLAELAEGGIALPVVALAANPPAIVHRLIRLAVEDEFGRTLSRAQTLAVARLVFAWHGQEGVDLPGIRVVRAGGRLEFTGA
ncbi:tRNA lysidine(34) synthetase TilS [Amnibacterium setariae]|uniref:tRNA(Ile)-lysidine synthase n=1 Tax=Amnibacterium setariae TaxID=2306585 RepID=A0A3A1U018_9MICO|nr:tRNA lysidine(34) synthetase TilS [Amnibacterium setariae]RIX30234.1 tRNA lysidine(34) synthetase TilS [Amnibacterium setariae]